MALHNIQLGILNQNKQTGSSSPRRPAACAVQPRAFNFDKTPTSSRASASASISGTPPVPLSPSTLSSLTASPSAPLLVPLASSHPTSTQDATLSPILAPHPTPRSTRPASSSTPQLSPRDPRSLAVSLSSHPASPLVAGPTPRPVPQASSHHPTPRSLPVPRGLSATILSSPTHNHLSNWSLFCKLLEKYQALIGGIALVLAILALGPGYATVAPTITGLNIAKWTAQKDFRESCFADLDRNFTSLDCESAMHGTLSPPPIRKRVDECVIVKSGTNWRLLILVTAFVCAMLLLLSLCLLGVHYAKCNLPLPTRIEAPASEVEKSGKIITHHTPGTVRRRMVPPKDLELQDRYTTGELVSVRIKRYSYDAYDKAEQGFNHDYCDSSSYCNICRE
ncbi:hypothetical protein F5882DRAFT_523001 [Hyaloscypha sp. PMI_1271]|nr:hypothetical protein F5882DRAFT_523001 [Hyaloscypha sp. PMI_1271]